jgi:hypothetical protein
VIPTLAAIGIIGVQIHAASRAERGAVAAERFVKRRTTATHTGLARRSTRTAMAALPTIVVVTLQVDATDAGECKRTKRLLEPTGARSRPTGRSTRTAIAALAAIARIVVEIDAGNVIERTRTGLLTKPTILLQRGRLAALR